MPKEVPREIQKQLAKWGRQATILRVVNVLLGITAIIASILVAAKINSFEKTTIEWLAVVAAASAGLLASLNMGPKSNRMAATGSRPPIGRGCPRLIRGS